MPPWPQWFNTSRPRQMGCNLVDDIFKLIFLHENCYIFIQISLKIVHKDPIIIKTSLVQTMFWCQRGNKQAIIWTNDGLLYRGYGSGGRFKNTYELLNQRALKFSYVNKIHIFQCMGKIFCVEFQRYPLKFHTKYLTHTLKDMIFMQFWNFKSS